MGCQCLATNQTIKNKLNADSYDLLVPQNNNPNNIQQLKSNNYNLSELNKNSHNIDNPSIISIIPSTNNLNPEVNILSSINPHSINENNQNKNAIINENINNINSNINININNNNISNNINNESSFDNNQEIGAGLFLQSKQNIFFDYEIIENEYVGKGVKRMHGYISPVSFEELKKIRENFWTSRIEGNPEIWKILRYLCDDRTQSNEELIILMESIGLVTLKGCINATFDDKGMLYEIPNYCINDPLQYKTVVVKEKPNKENIEIIIKNFGKSFSIKTNNYIHIKELKKMIIKRDEFSDIKRLNVNNVRLFFGGKELVNEKHIWYYDIFNKYVIQMMLSNFEYCESLRNNKKRKNEY